MSAAKASASDRIGRGTRWTEEQVAMLLDTVKGSDTAKEAFEQVAGQLGKSVGTVQQKYYNLQRKASGGSSRRGAGTRRRASSDSAAASPRRSAGGSLSASELRDLSIDDLVSLASRVKNEVDRRRQELEAATALFG